MTNKLMESFILYAPIATTLLLWATLRPHRRIRIAIGMTTLWHAATLPWLNLLAQEKGWWRFETTNATFLGMPLSAYLGWVVFWGIFATLMLGKLPSRYPVIWTAIALLVFDIIGMPYLEPTLILEKGWLIGEVVLFVGGLLPGLVLAHFTMLDRRPELRAFLISIAFTLFFLITLPFAHHEAPLIAIHDLIEKYTTVQHCIYLGGITLLGLPAMSAVREFSTQGGGTPIPFDPPKRLVTSGVYAYLKNPMQLSMTASLLVVSFYLDSPLALALAGLSLIYSLGLARWSEDKDLSERHGEEWKKYQNLRRAWLPHLLPAYYDGSAVIYFDLQCRTCREMAQWFSRHKPISLEIKDANLHPQAPLSHVTYEISEGRPLKSVQAIAAALGHIHLGWAALGWLGQLPVVLNLLEVTFESVFARKPAV